MGQLNIKDDELIAKAKRLAERRGTTTTGALRLALDEALARDEAEIARRIAAIRAISEEASKHVLPGRTSDHSDLYDEHGAPK
ncbi:hypothetical protein EJV46_15085 [Roseococcus sp. SYP-B2431]|uniref:type II toxin-antitoxin system VapB family antitoxin n=1 Tax=Roseococcus sp. SYP-B2431 TaxID=2496640 RepID=UPI00103FEAFB|nr:type II toxin-antitoxin system VapB family antitoxin [Roseococcus sp. SYP-B2431]TCH97452.1 hypothetical protein EJV46_15085 [Roseococcus sp. SYP-B2431]